MIDSRTVLHVGPNKTGTTSLQSIIPRLGRPYSIGPDWVKPFCRLPELAHVPQIAVAPGTIISAGLIGEFDNLAPDVIAKRILAVFGPSIIIYVHRNPEERMESFYNEMRKLGTPSKVKSLDEFKALHHRGLEKRGVG